MPPKPRSPRNCGGGTWNAHISSPKPDPWLHTCNHAALLTLALRQHDRREAFGQVVRLIVAAPGSLTGRYPAGNTGRLAAGLMTPPTYTSADPGSDTENARTASSEYQRPDGIAASAASQGSPRRVGSVDRVGAALVGHFY